MERLGGGGVREGGDSRARRGRERGWQGWFCVAGAEGERRPPRGRLRMMRVG